MERKAWWRSPLIGIVMAFAIVALASALRVVFLSDLGRNTAYLTYYPAIAVAALLGGLPAGIVATLSSALLAGLWIQGGQLSGIEALAMGVFVLSCSIITWMAENMRRAETKLSSALKRQEMLYSELLHRTKNNMGVIVALLGIRSENTMNEETRLSYKEMQGRIRSMAVVHKMLNEYKDLSYIRLDEYIKRLMSELCETFTVDDIRIAIKTELQPVEILIDTALPCGLILNELFTNALKHAFPGGRQGTISIKLTKDAGGSIALEVADDGVGLSPGFDPRADGSTGMATLLGLAENQLMAAVSYAGTKGTTFSMVFKDNLYTARV